LRQGAALEAENHSNAPKKLMDRRAAVITASAGSAPCGMFKPGSLSASCQDFRVRIGCLAGTVIGEPGWFRVVSLSQVAGFSQPALVSALDV
jgi:hypothetical protein